MPEFPVDEVSEIGREDVPVDRAILQALKGERTETDATRNVIRKLLHEAQDEQDQRYPDAGGDAQPEVQEAIKRYNEMSPEERGNEPLLYWLLGSGTPPYKDSREATEYTDKSETEGQTCGNCSFTYFRTATQQFICSQIRGVIQPGGWCNRWEASEPVDPVDTETGVQNGRP